MKKLGFAAALLVFAAVFANAQNLFTNGDFSNGQAPWFNWNDDGSASMKVENGQMAIKVNRWGSKNYSCQTCHKQVKLETGVEYKLSFDAYCTVEREMGWRLQKDSGGYDGYAGDGEVVKLGTSKEHYEFTFTMESPTDAKTSFCLNVGKPNKDAGKIAAHTIYFDNFVLEPVK